MKKTVVSVLSALLLMTVSTGALAAVHDSWGDFSNKSTGRMFDSTTYGGWYYIEPESPYLIGNLRTDSHRTDLGALYYKNDFNFAEAGTVNDTDDAVLRGSYLFENGVFAGLDAITNEDYFSMISVGYLYPLAKNSFVAISGDYGISDQKDSWLGLEVDFRYYTDQMRVFGQVYCGDEDSFIGDDTVVDLDVNYKVDQNLVGGAGISLADDNTELRVGGTYTMDALVGDGRYRYNTDGANVLEMMGMYQFTDELNAGLYCRFDDSDNDSYVLKAKYTLDKVSQLRLSLELNNDNEIQLAYYKTF